MNAEVTEKLEAAIVLSNNKIDGPVNIFTIRTIKRITCIVVVGVCGVVAFDECFRLSSLGCNPSEASQIETFCQSLLVLLVV